MVSVDLLINKDLIVHMSVYKHGNWWIYDFTLHSVRYKGRAGRTKTEAIRVEAKVKSKVIAGDYNIQFKPSKTTFEEVAEIYLKRRSHLRSHKRDALSIRTLLRYFQGKRLRDTTADMIEDYKAKRLSDGVAHATINRELAALKTFFNCAIRWKDSGYNYGNPMSDVDLLKEPPGRTRYLTIEEIERLIACCDEYFKPIIIAALNTGMRHMEILDMKWRNIYIRHVVQPYLEIVMSKANKKRIVPLNDIMVSLLKHLHRKTEYVFLNKRGTDRLRRTTKPFQNALQKADIADFRFHDLRHTFASHFVMGGGDLLSLKEILGHSSMRMVERYSHLSSEHKARQMRKLYQQFPQYSPNLLKLKKGGE